MTEGEVSNKVMVKEKCGFDVGLYRDPPPLNCVGNDSDLENTFVLVSGINGVGDKDGEEGFLLHRKNGEAVARIGDDVRVGLNAKEFGNAQHCMNTVPSLMFHTVLNHDASLDHGDPDQVLFDGSHLENDATVEKSVPNGIYGGEALEEKVVVGDIDDEVKGECCLREDLENSDTTFSSLENQGPKFDTLVPFVESFDKADLGISLQENSSSIATGECELVTVLSSSEVSIVCHGSDNDTVRVVSCSESKQLDEGFSYSEPPCRSLEKNGDQVGAVMLATEPRVDLELESISCLANGSGDACLNELQTVGTSPRSEVKFSEESEHELKDMHSHGVKSVVEVIVNSDQEEKIENNVSKTEDNVESLELAVESGESGEMDTFSSLGNANCEMVDQINLDENMLSKSGLESQGELLDVAENGLNYTDVLESVAHDETMKCQRDSECSSQTVEIREAHVQASEVANESSKIVELHKFSSHTDNCVKSGTPGASDSCNRYSDIDALDSDCCPNNESGSTLEMVSASSTPQQCDDTDAVVMSIENVPEQIHDAVNTYIAKDEPVTHLNGGAISFGTMASIIKIESSAHSPSIPASNGHVPEIEVETAHIKSVFNVPISENSENGVLDMNGQISSEARTVSESKHNGFAEPSDSNLFSFEKLKEDFPTIYESYPQACIAVNSDRCSNIPSASSDLKLKPETHTRNIVACSNEEDTGEVRSLSCDNGGHVELKSPEAEEKCDEVEDSARSSNWKTLFQENEKTQNYRSDNVSDMAPEYNNTKNPTEGEARMETKTKKPFNFLVRMPRSDNESNREQIRLAKIHVDEKTKLRDAIQDQIQKKRANSQIHATEYEYAKAEARNARKLVRLKRFEIDSLHSVINKAKNAMSIGDIDIQIRKMENMIQHETLPLKEEKALIREIKQLKQLREQLSSSLGNQDEINQALEQRKDVEERLKILKKELDILKDSVLKAEETAIESGKKYENENMDVHELRSQFREADDVRQAAYAHLQSLKQDLWKKNKLFFKYKDDAAIASNYAFGGNSEALYGLCFDQVEKFMEIWNGNDEFRREYTDFNARSTLRRFGTLDGRSLGPVEKPTILVFSSVDNGVNRSISKPVNFDLTSMNSSSDSNEVTMTTTTVPSDGGLANKVAERVNRHVKVDNHQHSETKDNVHEKPDMKISTEEAESRRKDEDKRRENAEAEAELKRERRLEELAKANEAKERKKRQLEKLQMRAELKSQKEALQREKELEKRLRKKERKRAAAITGSTSDTSDISNNCETTSSIFDKAVMDLNNDIETKDKLKKSSLFSKYTKTKTVPPGLRYRNKKKWQQWIWITVTTLFILVLFWLGNVGIFTGVNLKRRSPVY